MSSTICNSIPTKNTAICEICPRRCNLAEGSIGNCHSRINLNGTIVPLAYNKPCSIALDPVEKKPMFHFYPGTAVLSLGMAGCNLHCKNCQNASISQICPNDIPYQEATPSMLINWMKENNIHSIAYTYTEPLVCYEYVLDCSKAMHKEGFKNILVSAGYINPDPLNKLLPYLDGANIDLKTMSKEGYRENCGVERDVILKNLRTIAKSDCILEVTNLIIPNFNDTTELLSEWCKFIHNELGEHIPVHFSRFFPLYQMTDREATPIETLKLAKKIALDNGLKYVYTGNIPGAETTYCPKCNTDLIVRNGFNIMVNKVKNSCCPHCGTTLYGRF